MNKIEAGHMGGVETSFKWGVEQYRCPTCGQLPADFTSPHHKKVGSKGGLKTLALYGREHMRELARLRHRMAKKEG